ncbi:hypothetical protein BXZ70DRAFT_524571, partial [Cristinia sonorae]
MGELRFAPHHAMGVEAVVIGRVGHWQPATPLSCANYQSPNFPHEVWAVRERCIYDDEPGTARAIRICFECYHREVVVGNSVRRFERSKRFILIPTVRCSTGSSRLSGNTKSASFIYTACSPVSCSRLASLNSLASAASYWSLFNCSRAVYRIAHLEDSLETSVVRTKDEWAVLRPYHDGCVSRRGQLPRMSFATRLMQCQHAVIEDTQPFSCLIDTIYHAIYSWFKTA